MTSAWCGHCTGAPSNTGNAREAKEKVMGWHRFLAGPAAIAALLAGSAAAEGLTDGMGNNGLSAVSLFDNALTTNRDSLEKLIANPLSDSTFNDADLGRQLLDSAAQAVMKDLVSCALPDTANVRGFHGEMGLRTGETGDWST